MSGAWLSGFSRGSLLDFSPSVASSLELWPLLLAKENSYRVSAKRIRWMFCVKRGAEFMVPAEYHAVAAARFLAVHVIASADLIFVPFGVAV